MTRLLALALLLAAPAAGKPKPSPADIPAPIASPRADDPMGVTIHRLPNGLTVYLSPNKSLPRISAWTVVRAGSRNDPADSTGMAHYLEHMLFKGSTRLGTIDHAKEKPHLERIRALYEKLFKTKDAAARESIIKQIDAENIASAAYASPNEIARFYRLIGGKGLNAFTQEERTAYIVDVPSNRLEAWAVMESERFKNPVFRLFQGELEAVYEEKNQEVDDADWQTYLTLQKALYPKHPYSIPIGGTMEHLKNPSLEKMYEFFENWYAPNNLALVLAGDFERERALALVSKHFGSIPARPLPKLPPAELPLPKGDELHEHSHEAEEKVVVAWHTAPAGHADADALIVMDMLVDNAAAGLLNLRLNQAQKVKASGSGPRLRNEAGSWQVWALPKLGQTPEQAKALLLEQVEALKNGEFDEADIAAIITDFEVMEKRRLETNGGRNAAIADSFAQREEWERSYKRLERLRAVTKADVLRVARKYLGENRVTVIRRNAKQAIPKIDKPNFTKVSIDPGRQSEFLKHALALPAPKLEPRWLAPGRDYQIGHVSGGRLYAVKNPENDLFSLELVFDRGWRHERALCKALDLLDLSGAGPYSPEEFKKRLYALGASLSYSCSERESSARLEGIDRNFWPSLELMLQRFDFPNVSSGTLARMIEVDMGAREDEKRNPDAVHAALGELAQRGKDSPVLARLTNDELKKLDEGRLKALINDFPMWKRRVGYVGPRSAGEIAKLLQTERPLKTPPAKPALRYLKPAKTELLFTHRDMVNAQLGFFAPSEVFDPERVVDYQYYSQYMGGGMSSLIFQEVREARALAYSAAGGHAAAADKGDELQFWGWGSCQADKTVDFVKLMLELYREFPMAEARFQETAKGIEESYRTSPLHFRSVPGALMSWEDQGLPPGDPRPARFERALKYTPQELAAFGGRLKDKPMTIWILGHRERLDFEKLKAVGELREKALGDIFPY